MRNIKDRIEFIGGQFECDSVIKKGVSYKLVVPIKSNLSIYNKYISL